MGNWELLRLYSVHNSLLNNLESVERDLLRYGYLVKSNLSEEYQSSVVNVDYSLCKMSNPCVILHIDKTSHSYSLDYCKIILEVNELVGEDCVNVYENTDTDLIIDILI